MGKKLNVVQLSMMCQAEIEFTTEKSYETKRDKLVSKLEKLGLSVDIESEEDYGTTGEE